MKSLIVSICILGMVGVVIGVVVLAATDTVNCTVTPGQYAVTLDATDAAFGTMQLSASSQSTPELITGTGSSSLVEKFLIYATDATYAEAGGEQALCADTGAVDTCTWALSAAVGADAYVLAFATSTSLTSGTAVGTDPGIAWVALSTSGDKKTLDFGVATSGSQSFELDMRTPSSGPAETAYGKQYSSTLTVEATAP